MARANTVEEVHDAGAVSPHAQSSGGARFFKRAFCAWVILLAIFQFSENTADPDLWGHVVFGQEMIREHGIPKHEIYSWTATGQPWINHEVIAELALGGAHALMGGSGILLLKMLVGLLTFGLCLRMGLEEMRGNERLVAWAFAALAVVEISFGFSARPQIFTALCLVLELMLLRRIHAGRVMWAFALPLLFIFWINTHGGALAGVGLLGLAAAATTAERLFGKRFGCAELPGTKTIVALWLALVGVIGGLFCNPWGAGLVKFLIDSVSWLRPEIQEWNPTPMNWDHAASFMIVALGIFGWLFTRRRRPWWEMAAFAAFALLALRSVRNVPLFALVALALVPRQLADALVRHRNAFARFEVLASRPQVQSFVTIMLVFASAGTVLAAFTLHKEHPLTMEVPRDKYPVSAMDFIRQHDLQGKLLVFFDWGEMTIFELPQCPPSIDPRLDTCYSRDLIAGHWKFYNGGIPDQKIFDPFAADLALLPVKLAGALTLVHHGWKAVYYDDTAVLFARDLSQFSGLKGMALPIEGAKSASLGRSAFADRSARWLTSAERR